MSFDAVLSDWLPAANGLATADSPPGDYWIKPATEAWELAGARGLRRAVFCVEQGLFEGDDRDPVDAHCTVLVALACVFGMPDRVVGTVRIHRLSGLHWQGSRLAVARDCRRLAALGTGLIQLAGCTASARGAARFTAQVQLRHRHLFERLHWQPQAAITVQGAPHLRMQADLAHYPARLAQPRVLSATARAA
ncbi:MSMEG_0567/Sll0786 family nitrogen starvation N-acetyltransferase [Polycyclovorans algicola]|uniref:MSMEG_0567/Sll0786 family nitrogen starvation N-acetyltransferase n=1 Tax=Polycyclovorans algicola TaxID=616992 RepID=UPI00069500CB|nr:MSMEG_0567/Sll0786 family nitrogen starvation N-acetyltransferase [Polycyclovorans algicola]